MTREKHFHPFAALRFLRKTLAVYLIPLVNVLLERNWAAFWLALRQDAVLFGLLCGISWVLLQCSSWQLDEAGVLHLRWKLLFHTDTLVRGEALAALTIERPLLYRLAGASQVTLYPIGQGEGRTLRLCLRRADAEFLADCLLPVDAPTTHHPAGSERAALVLLGANGLSTFAVAALAIRPTRQLPLAAGGRGVAALPCRLPPGRQPGAQFCPDCSLRGLAHGRPAGQPGRLDRPF